MAMVTLRVKKFMNKYGRLNLVTRRLLVLICQRLGATIATTWVTFLETVIRESCQPQDSQGNLIDNPHNSPQQAPEPDCGLASNNSSFVSNYGHNSNSKSIHSNLDTKLGSTTNIPTKSSKTSKSKNNVVKVLFKLIGSNAVYSNDDLTTAFASLLLQSDFKSDCS